MSTDSDRVLQLGRDLAESLDHSDVVGRWMSHHLAELIHRCEKSPDDKELNSTTRNVVLGLWEHKSGAPFRTEPYAYLRPVLRALERLDPNPAPWAFYRPFGENAPSPQTLASYPLLQTACDLDREVGQLIRQIVGIAAREAISSEEPWVISGKDTAKTEEDRTVRALEQLVRRLGYQSGADTDEPLDLDTQKTEPSDQEDLAGNTAEESAVIHVPEAVETLDSADPLTLAAHGSYVRCRRLFDRLADMCGKAPETNDE